MINTPEILSLRNEDGLVRICPDIGGAIATFSWRDLEILRPATEAAIRDRTARQMGCYPLVPYSNRIGNGDLLANGKAWRLRANSPPEPHAIHGFGWQRPWQVIQYTDDFVQLALQHSADVDWPFACEAVETIRLNGDSLLLSLSVRNNDDNPMPAGLGFHPLFPKTSHTRLQTHWTGMWKMNANMLPTEKSAILPEADFSHSRLLDHWKVDNCFTGWNQQANLDYPTHRTALRAASECAQLVCFAPHDGRNFIALEPVTHINNAFALAAHGVAGTGMRILAPGDKLEIWISMQASLPSPPVSSIDRGRTTFKG